MRLRSHARFPAVAPGAAHYESFYLKAADPAGERAVWIRYTVWKAPGEAAQGALWLTLFGTGGPSAFKAGGTPTAAPDAYIRIGEASLTPAEARGEIGAAARWELSYTGDEPAFPYLPAGWLYGAPLPRTKAISLYPAVRFSGRLQAGEREIALEGWPGMIGHNWGSEHPRRGIWLHAAAFEEEPDAYFDAIIGQVKVGPVTSPWIGNGCLTLDGVRHRLGGVRPGATAVTDAFTEATFRLRGDGIEVDGEAGAPAERFVAWRYSDPSGGWHPTLHCSIADMRLRVTNSRQTRELTLRGGASYELQTPERSLPVALQPHPDP